jgi:hypothetical protein
LAIARRAADPVQQQASQRSVQDNEPPQPGRPATHREFTGGTPPDWAIELIAPRR